MQLSIDDGKPYICNPEIGHPLTTILGHCPTMMPEVQRQNVLGGKAGEILAQFCKAVPELVEILHLKTGGARTSKSDNKRRQRGALAPLTFLRVSS
jgi:uncharacterized protein